VYVRDEKQGQIVLRPDRYVLRNSIDQRDPARVVASKCKEQGTALDTLISHGANFQPGSMLSGHPVSDM
jgi:hypothetical protein